MNILFSWNCFSHLFYICIGGIGTNALSILWWKCWIGNWNMEECIVPCYVISENNYWIFKNHSWKNCRYGFGEYLSKTYSICINLIEVFYLFRFSTFSVLCLEFDPHQFFLICAQISLIGFFSKIVWKNLWAICKME